MIRTNETRKDNFRCLIDKRKIQNYEQDVEKHEVNLIHDLVVVKNKENINEEARQHRSCSPSSSSSK